MGFSTLLFLTRLPSLTPAEFRDYYENKHMPLMREQAAELWSTVTTTRRYVAHTSDDSRKQTPVVLVGSSGFCDFDAVVEYKFPDQKAFQSFSEAMYSDEVRRVREADEKKFIDSSKTRLLVLADS